MISGLHNEAGQGLMYKWRDWPRSPRAIFSWRLYNWLQRALMNAALLARVLVYAMAENHVNGFEEDEDFAECGRFSMVDALARRDKQGRALVLDRLERALRRWREIAADPEAVIGEGGGESVRDAQKQLCEHLWSALTLRWNAPFEDIRERMSVLLEDAKVNICLQYQYLSPLILDRDSVS